MWTFWTCFTDGKHVHLRFNQSPALSSYVFLASCLFLNFYCFLCISTFSSRLPPFPSISSSFTVIESSLSSSFGVPALAIARIRILLFLYHLLPHHLLTV